MRKTEEKLACAFKELTKGKTAHEVIGLFTVKGLKKAVICMENARGRNANQISIKYNIPLTTVQNQCSTCHRLG